jgi:O-acetylserine/cysteine efflux transporter
MKPADVCLAVLVAVIWGLAFVASRIALDEFSPALMTTLRFAIAAIPCLFVRKPDVSWPLLIGISFTLFLGQFLAQAYGIAHGVPVGLSSVIVQSQALFTVAFAAVAFGEIPTRQQTLGIGVAAMGLLLICGTVGYDFSVGAFAVLMICPVSFAIGNLLLRRAKGAPMFDLFAWLCLVAALPLVALTLVTDGVQPAWHALSHISLTGLVCMLALGGSPPASLIGSGAGCCATIRLRRWCRLRSWCRSSAPGPPASCSANGSDRCGLPACSPWSGASPSCCCRSGHKPFPNKRCLNKPRLNKSCPRSCEGSMSLSLLLASPGLHGCVTPHRVMQKQVSPEV